MSPDQAASDVVLDVCRAVGEPTRLRIVALLAEAELTVTDLTDILRQSQPRVSRHLKLLTDCGAVERSREGSWAFFALARHGERARATRGLLDLVDGNDPLLVHDRLRLASAQASRTAAARRFFDQRAQQWDELRRLHVADEQIEPTLLDMVADRRFEAMLDLGTGTGRMLELLGDRADRGLGIDSSARMLAGARANLERGGLTHCTVRQADLFDLPLAGDSFDLVVIHQVLHLLDHGDAAVAEAARVLAPGGMLLIVDFAPHNEEALRIQHAHRRLGFGADVVTGWLNAAGLTAVDHITLAAQPDRPIAVTVWRAVDTRSAPARRLEETLA